jgi:hypothetical protein
MYKALIQTEIPVHNNKKIWMMKKPVKTKKIGWHLHPRVILMKDTLSKRNWHGNKQCVCCYQDG